MRGCGDKVLFYLAIANDIEAFGFYEVCDFVESFGLSWYDDKTQQGHIDFFEQFFISIDEQNFFIGAGTAGDENCVFGEVEFLFELVGAIDFIGNLGSVVFQ